MRGFAHNAKEMAEVVLEKVPGSDGYIVNKLLELLFSKRFENISDGVKTMKEVFAVMEKIEYAKKLRAGDIKKTDIPAKIKDEVESIEGRMSPPSFGKYDKNLSEFSNRQKHQLYEKMMHEGKDSVLESLIAAGKGMGIMDAKKEADIREKK